MTRLGLLVISALALAQSGSDARYQRLAERLQEFRGLPPARQDRLRQLDEQLHTLDSDSRDRMQQVLEDYNRWLLALPESDRRRVIEASNPAERLEAVRDLRLREAAERLPRKLREKIDSAPEGERPALRDRFLREQRQRRRAASLPQWDEALTITLPPPFDSPERRQDLIRFVRESLSPRLTLAYQERLWFSLFAAQQDEGREFFQSVAALTDRATAALPGPIQGPDNLLELPREVQAALAPHMRQSSALREELALAPRGWPQYAQAVTRIAAKHGIALPKSLGPTTPAELAVYPGLRAWIDRVNQADPMAAQRLQRAEGRWPDYPRTLQKEAARLGIELPGLKLPGPPKFWDSYRTRPAAPTTGRASKPAP
jgi:hypothetical protein